MNCGFLEHMAHTVSTFCPNVPNISTATVSYRFQCPITHRRTHHSHYPALHNPSNP